MSVREVLQSVLEKCYSLCQRSATVSVREVLQSVLEKCYSEC